MGTHAEKAVRNTSNVEAKASAATLFGVPIGELGWFASLLMGTAAGFAAFFAATFLGIVAILLINSTGHGGVDYANSYRLIGLPVGLAVLAISLGYLGTLWVRRMTR